MSKNVNAKHDVIERLFILTTVNYITNKKRVDDKLQWQQDIHHLNSLWSMKWFVHGLKPKSIDETLFAWIGKYKEVNGSDLHLDAHVVIIFI